MMIRVNANVGWRVKSPQAPGTRERCGFSEQNSSALELIWITKRKGFRTRLSHRDEDLSAWLVGILLCSSGWAVINNHRAGGSSLALKFDGDTTVLTFREDDFPAKLCRFVSPCCGGEPDGLLRNCELKMSSLVRKDFNIRPSILYFADGNFCLLNGVASLLVCDISFKNAASHAKHDLHS